VNVVLLKGKRAVAGYELKLSPFSGSEASRAGAHQEPRYPESGV
jgi:hypothetical protein